MENKLQELTKKLYDEGLEKGRAEADRLVGEAKNEAAKIVAEARAQAEEIVKKARDKAEDVEKNTMTEIALAGKQAAAKIKSEIASMIVAKATAAGVKEAALDPAFIKEMLLAVARNWNGADAGKVELKALLPEAERTKLDAAFGKSAQELLAAGIEVGYSKEVKSGFKVGAKDGGYYISFSDADFDALLGEYLREKVSDMLLRRDAMFATNYYCLVAGLKEYSLDADTKGFDAKAIVGEILEGVDGADADAVRLLYGYYDCENIASLRAGRSAHNPLGNFTREELEEEVKAPRRLPAPVARVLRAFADPEGEDAEEVDTAGRFESALFGAYYEACSRSRSRFLRAWSEFDRNLRNVTAAVTARAAGRPVEEVTVGGGDVVEQLERSSAADFGLRGELPYIDAVIAAVNDEANLVEKEHKIDLIRWNEAVELATFDYFDINSILSYLARVNIVARWTQLDAVRGREMFERLMAELDGKGLIENKQ